MERGEQLRADAQQRLGGTMPDPGLVWQRAKYTVQPVHSLRTQGRKLVGWTAPYRDMRPICRRQVGRIAVPDPQRQSAEEPVGELFVLARRRVEAPNPRE